jgi:hypothetical protein
MKRLLFVSLLAFMMVLVLVGTALAGEVTGSGKNSDQNQGMSWCSFSGLNDDPDAPISNDFSIAPNGPGGTSQSYGQDVRYGLAAPQEQGMFHPGEACNPQRTFLPPNPNRKK